MRDGLEERVCPSHEEIVSGLSELCTNLRWMIRISSALVPLIIGLGAYLVIQTVEIKTTLAVQDVKLERICKDFKEHKDLTK